MNSEKVIEDVSLIIDKLLETIATDSIQADLISEYINEECINSPDYIPDETEEYYIENVLSDYQLEHLLKEVNSL